MKRNNNEDNDSSNRIQLYKISSLYLKKKKNYFISNWLNVFNIILNNLQIKKIFNKFSSQLKFLNIIINEFSGDINLLRI